MLVRRPGAIDWRIDTKRSNPNPRTTSRRSSKFQARCGHGGSIVKNFARVCSSARTDKSPSVREKNSDNAAEVSYLAAESGNLCGPGRRPGPHLRDIQMFDCCLPVTSGNLIGESFASTLENHARYPSLRKGRDADLLAIIDCLVEQRIRRIAKLLPGLGFDGTGIVLYQAAALNAFRSALPIN